MQYTYFPLQHPDNIRLLRVWPFHHYQDEDCVHVSIFEYTRSEAPPYTALSYVWGSQTELVEVKIVGGSKMITLKLCTALLELEKDAFQLELDNSPPKLFWIDALCINQADDAEKSYQVRRMKDLYANADEVVAFLGTTPQRAERWVSVAFDLCREYERRFKETDWFDREASFRAGRLSDADDKALQSVFNRMYFMRVWVLQEFAGCSKTTVRGGSHSMDVETFLFATMWLWRAFDPHCLVGLKGYARVLNVFHVRTTVREGSEGVNLLDILVTGRETSASDPRDKVFGLVGLLDDELVSGSIRPDYSKTVQQVYTDVAKHLIQTTNDLAVFCYGGLGNSQISELPSWVPDWSAARKKDGVIDYMSKETFTDEKLFKAHHGRRHTSTIDNRLKSILCRGLTLDRVKSVHDVKKRIFRDSTHQTGVSRQDFFAPLEELGSEPDRVYEFTKELYDIAYFRTLSTDGTPYDSRLSRTSMWEHFPFSSKATSRGPLKGWGPDEVWKEAVNSVRQITTGRRMFITDKGYLGLGVAEVGDTVSILSGGSVPFVLRLNSVGHYQLVSECYVHGVMDGEAVGGAREEDFEDFVIV